MITASNKFQTFLFSLPAAQILLHEKKEVIQNIWQIYISLQG